jgi:hypothetical protein
MYANIVQLVKWSYTILVKDYVKTPPANAKWGNKGTYFSSTEALRELHKYPQNNALISSSAASLQKHNNIVKNIFEASSQTARQTMKWNQRAKGVD